MEGELGLRLFQRTTRRASLTEAGPVLARKVRVKKVRVNIDFFKTHAKRNAAWD